ncbi:MAG: hypothetical protein ACJ70Z_07295 [Nitrososphaera sp.]
MSEIDYGQLRDDDYPITKKTIYMNNGAVAPTPISTIKAMTDFMLTCAEGGPDSSTISDYVMSLLAELRKRIAHLINCDHDEVVFVQYRRGSQYGEKWPALECWRCNSDKRRQA